ncbi:MAG: hypothetical protein HYT87_15925 [Nitrospirae bacterium]|nr:hypothetical protein [Nitrospirota bacterium]
MNKLLLLAERLQKKASEEFNAARRNGMEEADLIQAAEKGWLAAHRATNALLAHRGKKITSGTRRKEEELAGLEKKYPEIKKADILEKFARFHSRLHVQAGYMDYISAKLIERDLRAVGDYIHTVRRLVSTHPR